MEDQIEIILLYSLLKTVQAFWLIAIIRLARAVAPACIGAGCQSVSAGGADEVVIPAIAPVQGEVASTGNPAVCIGAGPHMVGCNWDFMALLIDIDRIDDTTTYQVAIIIGHQLSGHQPVLQM